MVDQTHGERRFSSPQSLAEVLASKIAETLRQAVKARGTASLVVRGGRTSMTLFEQLQYQDIPWTNVWITLTDERWVSRDAPDSNEGLVRKMLLRGTAKEAHFIGLKNEAEIPEAGQAACNATLMALPRPFDVVVLGMGNDGHIASLFPQMPELAAALDPTGDAICIPSRLNGSFQPRMSLTLAALLNSRWIVLHIVGDSKRRVYREACLPGPASEFTIRAVLQQTQVPVDVYWAP